MQQQDARVMKVRFIWWEPLNKRLIKMVVPGEVGRAAPHLVGSVIGGVVLPPAQCGS
jgi:hypothetical protein